uniref:tRNA (cytosine(34)-C(5))-methyltransferase n=1 Tax=Parascaris univalens TaxID=6257 RepID=A0A915AC98_PARUN
MVRRGIRGRKKNSDANFQNKGVTQNYILSEVNKANKELFEYYKRQGLIAEDEWESFISSLRDELPTSFRVQRCNKEAEALISLMTERYFGAMREQNDEEVHVPEPLPWYPFAYQMNMSRTAVRSQPVLKNFHNFLVTEAELGNISRQEAVSMIPPLLLDVKSHHKVLDACAAPGSKTMQIIEMMHEDSDTPSGLVVANDVDNSRCYLLVRQALKRMPTSNCVVINEDAAFMPTFTFNKDAPERILFDRVLCDVICSGDGTFRKNPELWRSWSPQKAIGLHKLQANIARRCLQLLAVDGLMVYSTCSLNPIEDEAVIAEMLRLGNGSIELVDVSDRLPQLKRSPGVSSWKVFDKDMTEYKSPDEVPEAMKKSLVPSMFPPTDEEKQGFHLERCFRILPHMQNTGGFFVAVLRKTHPISAQTPTRFCSAPPIKRRKTFKEDPFVFLKEDDERWKEIAEYYGILNSFPYKNLLGRTNEVDKKRTLYFVSDAVKEFLICNQDKVKVINAGLRMFGRVETKFKQCRFRMSQDGVRTILPFLTKRVVEVDAEDLLKILLSNEEHENYPREKLKCNEKLDAIDFGSVVLVTTRN